MLQYADLDGTMDAAVVTLLSGNFQPGESTSVTLDNFAFAENRSILFQNIASYFLADQ